MKSSLAITGVSMELQSNVSETVSVSIIRVNVLQAWNLTCHLCMNFTIGQNVWSNIIIMQYFSYLEQNESECTPDCDIISLH
jgi:hypothetical protein